MKSNHVFTCRTQLSIIHTIHTNTSERARARSYIHQTNLTLNKEQRICCVLRYESHKDSSACVYCICSYYTLYVYVSVCLVILYTGLCLQFTYVVCKWNDLILLFIFSICLECSTGSLSLSFSVSRFRSDCLFRLYSLNKKKKWSDMECLVQLITSLSKYIRCVCSFPFRKSTNERIRRKALLSNPW